MLQEKELDLTELSTYEPFYFINFDKNKFSFFDVQIKNTKYILYSKENIPFVTHPDEYINTKTSYVQYTDTEDLYDGLETLIASFIEAGYNEICEDVDEFIEVVTGTKCSSIFDPEINQMIKSYRLVDKNIRYDIYQHVIKVNKEHIKNNFLENEVLFTLFYKKNKQVTKAVKLSLRAESDNKIVTYDSFEDVVTYMKGYKKANNQQEPSSDPIIFEHIVNNESYFSDKLSGLKHNIPLTEFKPFDIDDIEEGRLYFWTKENQDSFLNSKIKFFVLQDRTRGEFLISGKTNISQFNQEYKSYNYLDDYNMRTELKLFIKKLKKKSWIEVSQDKIIEALSKQNNKTVIDASPTSSIFLEENTYDIYDHMIQHWSWDSDDSRKITRSYFFSNAEEKELWLKKVLASHKYFGEVTCKKAKVQKYLDLFTDVHTSNEKYLEQKPIKETLLQEISNKELLTEFIIKKIMKYSPLKIIEGDYEVAGDLMLDAKSESLIIKGDLKVGGTLYIHDEYISGVDNYVLIMGNTFAQNYVQNASCIFAKNVNIANISYLPSASIAAGGRLKTKYLIHSRVDYKIDNNIVFNYEFSMEDKSIFQDWFLEKGGNQYKNKFEDLSQGKDIFVENKIDETTHNNNRLLQSFKRKLKKWYSIYYVFAGFENLELECGTHYGHYIESDEMLNDIRQDTGYYLMSHDDNTLELAKENSPLPENNISTKDLAYRFFWVMQTFSSSTFSDNGPMGYWKSLEEIDTCYNNGKSHFKDDPHLALYWIMHLGLLNDDRFDDVKNIMQESENNLVKGAILFIEELKQVNTFTIEVNWDDKENTTLFAQRIKQYKSDIKKAQLSKDDIVAFTLDQFKEQPNKTLELLGELDEGGEWEKIQNHLDNNPYAIGFSFLRFKLGEDKKKWGKLFIQECENNIKRWDSSYLVNNSIETIFKDLSYVDREKALQLLFDTGLNGSKREKQFTALREWHRAHVDDKEKLATDYEHYVAGINKDTFTFQNLMDRSFTMDVPGLKAFINECVKQDKFSDECGQGTICHYLVLYWIADFFNAPKEEKHELAQNVITHYNLSEKEFYLNSSIMRMSKQEKRNLFKMIKRYL